MKLFEAIINFRGFRVFDLSHYAEIENPEILSRLVKLSEIILFEEVGLSKFSIYHFS